jgi:hypothetical protein
MTTAGTWDKLKYQLSKLDHFDTRDWDGHGFAWESFRDGNIINDASALWRYIDIERDDTNDLEVFEGRVVFLIEIDPVFG